jgi:dethiobiotin synthetase
MALSRAARRGKRRIMSAYFVTATGTDIGKTFVTAGLIRTLRAAGREVSALKPVASGFDPERADESDAGVLLQAVGEAVTRENIARISPWLFSAALSPDMAAAREGRAIDFSRLISFCGEAAASHRGALLIEGVGGVMVPLDESHTVLDWMKALDFPLIVVAGTYVGTISHTLTALDVLSRANLRVAALVLNDSGNNPVPVEETRATVSRFTNVPTVAVPRDAETSDAAFLRLAERLAK